MGFILLSDQWIQFFKQIKWSVAAALILLHVSAVRGLCILVTDAKWQTVIACYLLSVLAGIGVLAVLHSGQKSAIDWTLDHQTHHKYEGTNADAVSLGRGFFFAHIGWVVMERHPDCEAKRKQINVDYLMNDPLVRLQHQYYLFLYLVINCFIPTLIPYILFGETLVNSFYTCFALRYAYTMQLALSGNSFAHMYGYREYDKSSTSTHNKPLNYLTLGGAYHNYHHAFPYDYSASEFGVKSFNIYSAFIEFFHRIGWAYDLKRAPQRMVDNRRNRTGGEVDTGAVFKRRPIVDWIIGWFISFNIVWTVIIYRLLTTLLF